MTHHPGKALTVSVLLIAGVAAAAAAAPPAVGSQSFVTMQHLFPGHTHGPHLMAGVAQEGSELEESLEPRIVPGGLAVAHKGDHSEPSTEGAIELLRIGELAWEPTLGFSDEKTLIYQGMGSIETAATFSNPIVHRTRDFGGSWEVVTPPGEQNQFTADPYLYIDPATSRIFTVNFLGLCSTLAWSDDGADSWDSTLVACGLGDHQNIFAGPPVSSVTEGYPNIVYYCALTGFQWASVGAACEKSLDGGRTFIPTGGLPFHAMGTSKEPGVFNVPGNCTGAIAPGITDANGVIYLPAGQCRQPWLAISEDEGRTWNHELVADNGMAKDYGPETWAGHESGVAVDAEGNVYYTWIADDHVAYLAVKRAGKDGFGDPIRVSPPNLTDATLPAIVVGDPGSVAIAYVGSENAPRGETCTEHFLMCGIEEAFPSYEGVTWNGYITVTKHALKDDPEFLTVAANPIDDAFESGFCGQIRCGDLGDFFDITIGPDGRPWAAFSDACLPGHQQELCEGPAFANAEGVVAHMVEGPKLVTGPSPHAGTSETERRSR